MPMSFAALIVFAFTLFAAIDASARVVFCVATGEPAPQQDYVVEPTSWMAFDGAEPAAISGSLRLRGGWRSCGGQPGDRRAAIEFLEVTNGGETLAHPPDPLPPGPWWFTAKTGELFRNTYYVREDWLFGTYWRLREDDGASALLDQWVEPIDGDEVWLHEVWMKRDYDGESLIDWTGPDGLPAHLDLALRIEASVRHCDQFVAPTYECRSPESPQTVGSMRLVASLPEPTAAASALAAIAVLFALRGRLDARARSDRHHLPDP